MPDKLFFPNRTQAPPGGWRYLVRETGVELRGVSEGNLIQSIQKHYRANNLVAPYDLSILIEEYICKQSPHYCQPKGPSISFWEGAKRTLTQVVSGTRTLSAWMVSGEFADDETATQRAKVCASCPLNQEPLGCASCKKIDIAQLVFSIIGKRVTAFDHVLKACEPCGCDLKVKVHVPLNIIKNKMPESVINKLPKHCWVLTEK